MTQVTHPPRAARSAWRCWSCRRLWQGGPEIFCFEAGPRPLSIPHILPPSCLCFSASLHFWLPALLPARPARPPARPACMPACLECKAPGCARPHPPVGAQTSMFWLEVKAVSKIRDWIRFSALYLGQGGRGQAGGRVPTKTTLQHPLWVPHTLLHPSPHSRLYSLLFFTAFLCVHKHQASQNRAKPPRQAADIRRPARPAHRPPTPTPGRPAAPSLAAPRSAPAARQAAAPRA